MISFDLPFWPFAAFRVNGQCWASLFETQPRTPTPPHPGESTALLNKIRAAYNVIKEENSPITQITPEPTMFSWERWPMQKNSMSACSPYGLEIGSECLLHTDFDTQVSGVI